MPAECGICNALRQRLRIRISAVQGNAFAGNEQE